MREFEFRAWHDDAGEMLFVGDDFGTTHPLDCCRYAACQNQGKHITLMQYTGLKDIDGNKIFEGDIVEDEEHYYSVISWDSDDCMFIASDVGAMADLCCPVKVIGNIHQNPELLK